MNNTVKGVMFSRNATYWIELPRWVVAGFTRLGLHFMPMAKKPKGIA